MTNKNKLDRLLNNLPFVPYCSNDLTYGCSPLPLKLAKQRKYIQINPPQAKNFLIFDVDDDKGMEIIEKAGLPKPNLCVHTKTEGHLHVAYLLKVPVWASYEARMAPLRYYRDIEIAYREIFKSDPGYSGFLIYNPFINRSEVFHESKYTLNQLRTALPKELNQYKKPAVEQEPGFGRNVYIFETARKWGYKEVRNYRNGGQPKWDDAVFSYCSSINQNTFEHQLFNTEVRSVAKSISNWIWQQDQRHYKNFKQRQITKGRKGGIAKGAKNYHLREQARILKSQDLSQRQIAALIGVSQKTISNWLRES